MSDEAKKMMERIDALAAQAQNYRYAGAYQRLAELRQAMQLRVDETKTQQSN